MEEGERGKLRNMMRMILKTVNVILRNAFFIHIGPFACELHLEPIFLFQKCKPKMTKAYNFLTEHISERRNHKKQTHHS